MNIFLAIPLPFRLAFLFVIGLLIGGQINRGIYRLAWHRRDIGPWSHPNAKAPSRRWTDRLPVLGWWGLRRESSLHGTGYWVRPLLIELACGCGLAWLYQWETTGGLVLAGVPWPPPGAATANFVSHAALCGFMIVATFIDIDEKTIPDAIIVPGTLLGLLFATLWPNSLLPVPVALAGMAVGTSWLHIGSPGDWPTILNGPVGLAMGCASFLAWCFALMPRTLWTRSGWRKAIQYLWASLWRHRISYILLAVGIVGCGVIATIWYVFSLGAGNEHWTSLLTALVGLAVGGGIVWSVRVIASAALQKEAMGFGDVTLMAMIGTYMGWQSTLLIFFAAPFAGMVLAVSQYLLTRRAEIAFGPFLCAATLMILLGWPHVWDRYGDPVFGLGWLIPAVIAVCLVLMAGMLFTLRILRLSPPLSPPLSS